MKPNESSEPRLIKLYIDGKIAEELDSAAAELGMKLNEYIKLILGQQVMQLTRRVLK